MPGEKVSIRGSDVVGGWQSEEEGIWSRNWDKSFAEMPIQKITVVQFPAVVAVGGKRLVYTEDLFKATEYSFSWNKALEKITLKLPAGVNPNKVETEISTRQYGIRAVGIAIKIKGIEVKHVASRFSEAPQGGAIDCWGYDFIVENCQAYDNLLYGIKLKGVNFRISRNTCNGNGGAGITGSTYKSVFADNITDNNCWILHRSVAAGIKIVGEGPAHNRIVRHIARGNEGIGIWFDYACRNNTVENCYLDGNYRCGIFVEASQGPNFILNNIIKNTHVWYKHQEHMEGCGVRMTNSANVYIFNNTFANNDKAGITVLSYGNYKIKYEAGPYLHSGNLQFINNIFFNNKEGAFALRGKAMTDKVLKSWTLANNVYFSDKVPHVAIPSGNPPRNQKKRFPADLAQWQKLTGQDTQSKFANPLFADMAKFTLGPASPCRNFSADVQEIIRRFDRKFIDFYGKERPHLKHSTGAVQ